MLEDNMTEDMAREGLNTCGYAGKWKNAKKYVSDHNPSHKGKEYWDAVRLHFLELGGEYANQKYARR